jgi:hypothetical protein
VGRDVHESVPVSLQRAAQRILEREARSREVAFVAEPREWLARVAAGGSVAIDEVKARLARVDEYLRIAPGWAQGVETEVRMIERALICAVIACIEDDAAAIAEACAKHAALISYVDAYAHARPASEAADAYNSAYARELVELGR